jgi:ubiquinone/menaquinone biosynthesis C-methylase UbiE
MSEEDKLDEVKDINNLVSKNWKSWHNKNKYYHEELLRYYKNTIPKESRILELGCGTGSLIGGLFPSYGVGVDISEGMVKVARKRFPKIKFICQDIESFHSEEKFEYIIISGTLGTVKNIQKLLQNITKMCSSDTRLVINYYNQLWNPIINISHSFKLKRKEIVFNWPSVEDIENFLYISGYQIIKRDFFLLFPKYFPLVSEICNKFLAKTPIIRRLCLEQFVVARINCPPDNCSTTSVVITCRDEEGNIEPLVKRVPNMGKHTEIIFVEGHSKDNTIGKIKEMVNKYPEKDIKLMKQKGIGQGDAFRMGFDNAKGDFVCWLEADLTTPPEEIKLFYDAYAQGKGEYVNGSRMVYTMEKDAMPFGNFLINRFFGNLFTIILGQRFTDTLCGFKAISKKNYMKIRKNITYFGDFDPFGDFELIFGAIRHNLKVVEIPVHYNPRVYGAPKAYGKTIISRFKHLFLLLRMSWKAFVKFRLF